MLSLSPQRQNWGPTEDVINWQIAHIPRLGFFNSVASLKFIKINYISYLRNHKVTGSSAKEIPVCKGVGL